MGNDDIGGFREYASWRIQQNPFVNAKYEKLLEELEGWTTKEPQLTGQLAALNQLKHELTASERELYVMRDQLIRTNEAIQGKLTGMSEEERQELTENLQLLDNQFELRFNTHTALCRVVTDYLDRLALLFDKEEAESVDDLKQDEDFPEMMVKENRKKRREVQ